MCTEAQVVSYVVQLKVSDIDKPEPLHANENQKWLIVYVEQLILFRGCYAEGVQTDSSAYCEPEPEANFLLPHTVALGQTQRQRSRIPLARTTRQLCEAQACSPGL